MLARRIGGLADRLGDLVGLAETDPDLALAIPDNEERAEAEATSALHDLGASIDEDNLLEKIGLVFVASSARSAIAAGSTTTAASTLAATADRRDDRHGRVRRGRHRRDYRFRNVGQRRFHNSVGDDGLFGDFFSMMGSGLGDIRL